MTIDIQRQIGAVARVVEDREKEGKPAKVVQLAQSYPTPIEDLWNTITDAERIPRWFAPISGDLKLGGKYQIEGNASGTITRCDAPHAVDATWEFGGGVSWIEVRLSEVGDNQSRVELSHIAYPDEHWDMFGPGAVGIGWDLGFLGLAQHLESGTSIPAEASEWGTSDEAKQFMTVSGNGWLAADLANGTDPEHAKSVAQATIGFYTGMS